jgi:hypothetical protein
MSNWNASNYNQRKAARLALVKPEWVKNPETGEEFYLRRVGGLMSSLLSGYMPAGLTAKAVEAWKEQGVEGIGIENAAQLAATLTPEQRAAGERETATLAKIIQQACVIPLLSNDVPEEVQFSQEWKDAAIAGLREKDKDFDIANFDPKELVFDPQELDEKDTIFLFQWAKGLATGVSLKGGNVVSTNNFRVVPKKLNRGTRAGANQSQVQQAS